MPHQQSSILNSGNILYGYTVQRIWLQCRRLYAGCCSSAGRCSPCWYAAKSLAIFACTSSGQQSPSLTQWLVPRTLFTGAATMSFLHFFFLVFYSNYNLKLSKPNVLPIFQQKRSTIEIIHNSLFCSSKNNFRVEGKMQCPLLSLFKTVYFVNKK
jgi:hypothetical protein